MKRSTFSPTQIAGILKEFDNGKGFDELTRVHGISRATLYKWRQRYGGMDASEMKRMYANLAMELDVAKYIIEKSSKALREKDHHRCRPPRAAQRHRQGVSFVAAQQGHLGAEALGKQVRETGEHTHGQRSRVYSQNSAKLEQDKRDRVQIYTTGETHSKRLSG